MVEKKELTKITPTKIATHQELATILQRTIFTYENLSPRKFNLQNVVTTKISTYVYGILYLLNVFLSAIIPK